MLARSTIALVVLSACGFDPQRGDPTIDQPDAPDNHSNDPPDDPSDPPVVYRDCMDALAKGRMVSGVITIDPDLEGSAPPFDVFCDMTTAGGGWTLVWSYGFTDYANFNNADNAITPLPTWSAPVGNQPTSTTVPLAPNQPGALEFARWIELGENFLVESNINHVISCTPGTGSLSGMTLGTVSCTVVRQVAPLCPTNVPTNLGVVQGALGLLGPDTYYYWDARTTLVGGNWPTHDPCGTNQQNHVKNVGAPYGAVFVRR